MRIIVTTLQKFPVIFEEVDEANGRNFAIICDEAHSSQTGSSAQKLKTALADVREVLKEYAEIEGIAEDKVDPQDKLVKELSAHGKHKNLSFFRIYRYPERHYSGNVRTAGRRRQLPSFPYLQHASGY